MNRSVTRQNRYAKLLNLSLSKDRPSTERTMAHIRAEEDFRDYITDEAKRYAGVSTLKDLVDLESQYKASHRIMPEKAHKPFYRETLSNTTQYRQVPGTSAIYGGHLAHKEQSNE